VGAPVRRYNATSARTLAVYLSSRDNPEQGLCHNPGVEIPVITGKRGTTKPNKGSSVSVNGNDNSTRDGPGGDGTASAGSLKSDIQAPTTSRHASSSSIESKVDKAEEAKSKLPLIVDSLDERTTIDHRSFVQNVFGTTAFKMLEWLTPRNLDILARSTEAQSIVDSESKTSTTPPQPIPSHQTVTQDTSTSADKREDSSDFSPDTQSDLHRTRLSNGTVSASQKNPLPKSVASVNVEKKASAFVETASTPSPTLTPVQIPTHRKWTDSTESQLPKGILNVATSPKQTETVPDMMPLSRDRSNSKPKRRLSRPSLVTSPTMRVGQLPPVHSIQTQPIKEISGGRLKIPESRENDRLTTKDSHSVADAEDPMERPPGQAQDAIQQNPVKNLELPQSVSRLTIEVIEFICDVLQSDNTCEAHFLQPYNIDDNFKFRGPNSPLMRNSHTQGTGSSSARVKKQWLQFSEQAFFDTLCKPGSLLRSFRDEEKNLFDTQTLWYLMLRMTRVAPSLVFHSLWTVAGTLFQPPKKLETAYDWAKETVPPGSVSNKAVSDRDAAHIINICLHALIAAAPLVSDARQLANMSRIRSYGLTSLGREQASALEPVELCLHYDDAFANDLALRLARRLFAAIPTRRRYAELLDLQRDPGPKEKGERDVLDAVLDTLKYIDVGSPQILYFRDSERSLHEKRIPTLILDWARTVMLQDWQASAEVPSDGPFGGALAMITAICKFSPGQFRSCLMIYR
jgi:hypothetical protein